VLTFMLSAPHLSTASATRCALPAVLGLPLVMVPLGEDLRQPNKGSLAQHTALCVPVTAFIPAPSPDSQVHCPRLWSGSVWRPA